MNAWWNYVGEGSWNLETRCYYCVIGTYLEKLVLWEMECKCCRRGRSECHSYHCRCMCGVSVDFKFHFSHWVFLIMSWIWIDQLLPSSRVKLIVSFFDIFFVTRCVPFSFRVGHVPSDPQTSSKL